LGLVETASWGKMQGAEVVTTLIKVFGVILGKRRKLENATG
jgi:hypothetical protein